MATTTPALVADNATLADMLSLTDLVLIGIFNAHDGPAALLRSARGQIARATPGESILGVTVTAIGDDTVIVQDSTGTTYALALPGS